MRRAKLPETRLKSEHGFTIVELMIALSVLSVLLVTATIVLIQIGALYSKGINSSNLQNATRTVVADISAQLQFSGKVPFPCISIADTCYAASANDPKGYNNAADGTTETTYAYCIGTTRYSYVLDRELGTDTSVTTGHPNTTVTPHVLWRDTLKGDTLNCDPLDLTQQNPDDGANIDGSGYEMFGEHMRLVRFKVTQVAGSSLYTVSVWASFGDTDLVNRGPDSRPTCNDTSGTQFCASSSITTQLTGRVY